MGAILRPGPPPPREFQGYSKKRRKQVAVSFDQTLQQAIDGQVQARDFLPDFVTALESMLEQFELSLEYQPEELVEAVNDHLTGISDGFGRCRELALEAIESEAPRELLLSLKEAHVELNYWLLDFQNAVWVATGPTAWGWANRIFRAAERYFEGEPVAPGLSLLVDQQLRELECRMSLAPHPQARSLIDALREVADWIRGSTQPQAGEIHQMLEQLRRALSSAAPWLENSQSAGLDQLIEVLQLGADPELILGTLEAALQQVRAIGSQFELAASSPRGWAATREQAETVADVAADLEEAIFAVADALEAGEDYQNHASVIVELRAELQELGAELERLIEEEGKVPCPSCEQLNAVTLRRCPNCGVALAAKQGEDGHTFEATDAAEEEAEPENVRSLRTACYGFQAGTLSLNDFQGEVARLEKIFRQVRQKLPDEEPPPERARAYLAALEDVGVALETLAQVEVPADLALSQGLSRFLRGSRRLQQARDELVGS